MERVEFETWLRTVCFQEPTKEAYDLSRESWNAALKKVSDHIYKSYMEGEQSKKSADSIGEFISKLVA